MAKFRAKFYEGIFYIIQKRGLLGRRVYDNMLYTKEDALQRLTDIKNNYPKITLNDKTVLKEIKV